MPTKKKAKTPAKDQWDDIHYGEISAHKNEIIRIARRMGFDSFFPGSERQGIFTYNAAIEFLSKQ